MQLSASLRANFSVRRSVIVKKWRRETWSTVVPATSIVLIRRDRDGVWLEYAENNNGHWQGPDSQPTWCLCGFTNNVTIPLLIRVSLVKFRPGIPNAHVVDKLSIEQASVPDTARIASLTSLSHSRRCGPRYSASIRMRLGYLSEKFFGHFLNVEKSDPWHAWSTGWYLRPCGLQP